MSIGIQDITLDVLYQNERISKRSIGVCRIANLNTLKEVIEYYYKHGTFIEIRNCGIKSDKELIEICKKYINNPFRVIETPQTIIDRSIEEIFNKLNPFKRGLLNRYIQFLINALNVRSKNVIINLFGYSPNAKDLMEKIFAFEFDFNEIRNIGEKSEKELNDFKENILQFVERLKTIENDKLDMEFTKLFLKTTFINLPIDFEAILEEAFDEQGKIRLFYLLQYLIFNDLIFKQSEKRSLL